MLEKGSPLFGTLWLEMTELVVLQNILDMIRTDIERCESKLYSSVY